MALDKRVTAEIDRLRALSMAGSRGGRIEQHRSLRQLHFPLPRLATMLLLPLLFNLASWALRDVIAGGWHTLFVFWLSKLNLPAIVTERSFGAGLLAVSLPHIELPSRAPDAQIWWLTLVITLAGFIATFRIPAGYLPVTYFLRFLCIIQASSLAYFAIIPGAFHYTVPEYLDGSLSTGVALILLIPWLHSLIYYVFSFSLARKALLTLLTLAFICLALPLQLLLHALLLNLGSVLMLPLLYLVCGLWLQILACIAIYGWAMSWHHKDALAAIV